MRSTFNSFSFGCRVNQAEMEEINQQLINKGFIKTEDNPNFFIINTCAVTQKAEREVRQYIYQLRKKFSNSIIILTGCATTYWRKNSLFKSLPVDLWINNSNKQNVVGMIEDLSSVSIQFENKNNNINKYSASARMLIKIQDGCHRYCSYCIVPYLRDKPRSIKINQIIKTINNNSWIKEVILTAINTEAYGKDTGERFVDLLKSVINQTNIARISLGSINPWSVDKKFIKFYREYLPKNRLINFFHLPLQSGSDKILNLMKREYTAKEFLEKVQCFKKINPLCFIATDIIVGFLDENDDDFKKTYLFLNSSPISKFHIFRFSKRPGTAADYLAKQFKEPDFQTKYKRAKILALLGAKKYQHFLSKHLNQTFSALVLITRRESFQQALLNNQIPVWIATGKNLSGEIKNVRIESLKNGCLFGRII